MPFHVLQIMKVLSLQQNWHVAEDHRESWAQTLFARSGNLDPGLPQKYKKVTQSGPTSS